MIFNNPLKYLFVHQMDWLLYSCSWFPDHLYIFDLLTQLKLNLGSFGYDICLIHYPAIFPLFTLLLWSKLYVLLRGILSSLSLKTHGSVDFMSLFHVGFFFVFHTQEHWVWISSYLVNLTVWLNVLCSKIKSSVRPLIISFCDIYDTFSQITSMSGGMM